MRSLHAFSTVFYSYLCIHMIQHSVIFRNKRCIKSETGIKIQVQNFDIVVKCVSNIHYTTIAIDHNSWLNKIIYASLNTQVMKNRIFYKIKHKSHNKR